MLAPLLPGQAQHEGRLDIARSALEAGLHLSPRHRLMQDRLLEVLLATGDLEAAADLAATSIVTCPGNRRMRQVNAKHTPQSAVLACSVTERLKVSLKHRKRPIKICVP